MNDMWLSWRNIARHKVQSALLVFVSFITFFVLTALVVTWRSFNTNISTSVTTRMTVINDVSVTQPLPVFYVDKIKTIPGIKYVTYSRYLGGYYKEATNKVSIFATDPETIFSVYPEWVASENEKQDFIKDKTGLMVGRALADSQGWKIGDSISLYSSVYTNKTTNKPVWSFTVRVIFDGKNKTANTSVAFFHYNYYQETVDFAPNLLNRIILVANDPSFTDRIAKSIDEMFENSEYRTKTQTEDAYFQSFLSQQGDIFLILKVVGVSMVMTILLINGNVMMMAIRRRVREIGILKSLGFAPSRVFRIVMGESVGVVLLGGVPGLLAAMLLVNILKNVQVAFSSLTVTGMIALQTIVSMIVFGVLTGFVPAWRAMRLPISTLLGRE